MENKTQSKILGKLVSDKDLIKSLKEKKKKYHYETIAVSDESSVRDKLIEEKEIEGWELEKHFKSSVKFKKIKSHDILFENKVWCLLASLGFDFANSDRNFELPYDKQNPKNNQQIDVFVKDNESVLYVECKSSIKHKSSGDFKKDMEAWKEKVGGIENSIKQLFPGEKLKTKFIFATQNQGMGEKDLDRLKNIGGIHFDEEKLNYFIDLQKQLGSVARFQLLGQLFSGETIPELENRIPAIKGKMGGHTYYSFSIEPEKLLKIGYVLHRSKANKDMLPTYQRVIKKSRLKKVKEFIINEESPGYFPNSIIINIDSKRKLEFDVANTQVKNAISNIGVLHLPKEYKSAYIIDGQHRLYGYSDTKYAKINSIPVVAFVNLSKSEQVNLFMQINENQEPVPKTLRDTLNADLKWDSSNKKEQHEALCSRIAISLSEDTDSVLYQYISVGEDAKVLTPTSISTGLKKGSLLGKVSKTEIEKMGLFYKGDLDTAFENLLKYLKLSFKYLTDNLIDDFEKEKDSFLFVNKGVSAMIMLFSDLVDLICTIEKFEVKKQNIEEIVNESEKYLDAIIRYVKEIEDDEKEKFMSLKGAGAPSKYWRRFQEIIHNRYPEFNPDGLSSYLENQKRALNSNTYELIKDIEIYLRKDIQVKLIDKYGDEWAWKKGVPDKVQDEAEIRMKKKNRSRTKEEETTEWDNLNLIHYREIISKNWSFTKEDKTRDNFLKDYYTLSGEEKIKKDEQTKWLVFLNDIRNIVSHVSSDQVSQEDYNKVLSIKTQIIQ